MKPEIIKECNRCGSLGESLIENVGPHAAKVVCHNCGAYKRFMSKKEHEAHVRHLLEVEEKEIGNL